MREIRARLREIKDHLNAIIPYSISFIEGIIERYRTQFPRLTQLGSFEKVDIREAAKRDRKLRYDAKSGYLGYDVNGNVLFDVSQYVACSSLKKTACSVMDVPEKTFVEKGMLTAALSIKTSCSTSFIETRRDSPIYKALCH